MLLGPEKTPGPLWWVVGCFLVAAPGCGCLTHPVVVVVGVVVVGWLGCGGVLSVA